MAQIFKRHLEHAGIRVVLKDGIKSFVTTEVDGKKIATAAQLQSGEQIPFDMGIVSIGVRAETVLARDAGLRIGPTGGIETNEYQQTTVDGNIYAAGDAAETVSLITGKKTRIALAGIANKQVPSLEFLFFISPCLFLLQFRTFFLLFNSSGTHRRRQCSSWKHSQISRGSRNKHCRINGHYCRHGFYRSPKINFNLA